MQIMGWPHKSDQERYEQSVRELFGKYFPEMQEANDVWRRWVMFARREKKDCEALLQGEFQEGFTARIVSMMVVPDDIECIVPREWMREKIDYRDVILNRQELSPSLKRYGGELICLTKKWVKEIIEGKRKEERCRDRLNAVIAHWLTIKDLDGTLAERLFECHEASHPEVWLKKKDSSHYALGIMGMQNIPERWRSATDARIRRFLLDEINENGGTSEAFKKGMRCYVEHVIDAATYGTPSKTVFTSQILFLLNEPIAAVKKGWFHNWRVAPVLKVLKEHHREYTAQWIAEEIIKTEDLQKFLQGGKNIEEGEALLEALGNNEAYKIMLRPFLTHAKEEWEEILQRGRRESQKRDEEEQEILRLMRR